MASYEARPAPASFDDFLNAMSDGVLVDEGLYEEFFAEAEEGRGARPAFISALPRPSSSTLAVLAKDSAATCPVCLQSLAALLTEEEYALASEHYFGDPEALGLRQLTCEGKHVVCARCASAWLHMNNSCPLCRATLDPDVPATVDAIEAQRHTERMLALFHTLFGYQRPSGGLATASGGGTASAPQDDKDDRSAFAGMYS